MGIKLNCVMFMVNVMYVLTVAEESAKHINKVVHRSFRHQPLLDSCMKAEVIHDDTKSPLGEISLCEVFRKTDNNEPVCYKHYNDATSSIDLMIGYSDPAAVVPDADCKSTVTFDPSQKWSYVNDVDEYDKQGSFKTPKKSIRTYATFVAKANIDPVVTGTSYFNFTGSSEFNVLSVVEVPNGKMYVYITCTGELEPLEYNEYWGTDVYMSIITVNPINAPVFCAALDALDDDDTVVPSDPPTEVASDSPTVVPSDLPSIVASDSPTASIQLPSNSLTQDTEIPSDSPTEITQIPSIFPTGSPTLSYRSPRPTKSKRPTFTPKTKRPTRKPRTPTVSPTLSPSIEQITKK